MRAHATGPIATVEPALERGRLVRTEPETRRGVVAWVTGSLIDRRFRCHRVDRPAVGRRLELAIARLIARPHLEHVPAVREIRIALPARTGRPLAGVELALEARGLAGVELEARRAVVARISG